MTGKRMIFLKELLNFTGVHPDRLNVTWVSSSEAPRFAEAVTAFVRRMRELGPSPLRQGTTGNPAPALPGEER
jgi:F420-non-reducing hydrogenase iron-sulfur subunit